MCSKLRTLFILFEKFRKKLSLGENALTVWMKKAARMFLSEDISRLINVGGDIVQLLPLLCVLLGILKQRLIPSFYGICSFNMVALVSYVSDILFTAVNSYQTGKCVCACTCAYGLYGA